MDFSLTGAISSDEIQIRVQNVNKEKYLIFQLVVLHGASCSKLAKDQTVINYCSESEKCFPCSEIDSKDINHMFREFKNVFDSLSTIVLYYENIKDTCILHFRGATTFVFISILICMLKRQFKMQILSVSAQFIYYTRLVILISVNLV